MALDNGYSMHDMPLLDAAIIEVVVVINSLHISFIYICICYTKTHTNDFVHLLLL